MFSRVSEYRAKKILGYTEQILFLNNQIIGVSVRLFTPKNVFRKISLSFLDTPF